MSTADCVHLFRCPISHEDLSLLDAAEIGEIRSEVAGGGRVHADGSKVSAPLADRAMGTADRRYVYRLEEDIAGLLPTLAIVRREDATLKPIGGAQNMVQSFYDEFGWVENADGLLNDTAQFVVMTEAAQAYRAACDKRVAAQLAGGEYLLDAASGAIPSPSYLALSEGYRIRVCLDFSMRALRGARRKLAAGRGIFVLGDLANLPFKDGAVDDAMSLHTLYHMPPAAQELAVAELRRVSRRAAVIVYTWDTSPLMDAAGQVSSFVGRVRRSLGIRRAAAPQGESDAAPALYFEPQGRAWFRGLRRKFGAELKPYAFAGTEFQRAYFRDSALGRMAARVVLAFEAVAPSFAAQTGQYPMFVVRKQDPRSTGKAAI